jgi:large subunit ribosomal protein L13e
VFPRKSNQKPKKGDSAPAETAAATQLKGAPLPVAAKAAAAVTFVPLTDALKAATAYVTLRQERTNAKLKGRREKKAKEAAEKGDKKEGAGEEKAAADE